MAGRAAVLAMLSMASVGATACSSALGQTDEELAAGFTADNPKRTDDLYLPDGGTQPCHQLNIVGNDCRDPAGYPTACCIETDGNQHLRGPVCSSFAPTLIAVQQVGKNFCCWAVPPFVDWHREEDSTQPCGFCGGVTPGENECCTRTRDIVQKYPIINKEDCPNPVQDLPAHPPSTNGCGSDKRKDLQKYIPEHFGPVSIRPVCDAHDFCYTMCGSDKKACDDAFYTAGHNVCFDYYLPRIQTFVDSGDLDSATALQVKLANCEAGASFYWTFLSDYWPFMQEGSTAFNEAQAKVCRCCN